VQELAAPGVRSLQPYQPGKPIVELEREYGVSGIIKLASNENPLGPSPRAVAAMREGLGDLALYPDGSGYELKKALAVRHGMDPRCITLGNGSNDVLVLLAEAFLTPDLEAVYSQYAFAVYPIAVQAAGARARVAPALQAGGEQPLGHDLDAMRDLVGPRTRLVFIANPNNPTGTWIEAGPLRRFVASVPDHVVVVVDEAYFEYSRGLGVPDCSEWLGEFPNLVVTRTFSKAFGLAGIRVGYGLSSPRVADLLNRIRQPFNVNSLALLGAAAAIEDERFVARSVAVNARGVKQLQDGLASLGLPCAPTAANFVLVDVRRAALGAYESLLRRGVIVRPVGSQGLPNHLRVSVGTKEQNATFLVALENAMEEGLVGDA